MRGPEPAPGSVVFGIVVVVLLVLAGACTGPPADAPRERDTVGPTSDPPRADTPVRTPPASPTPPPPTSQPSPTWPSAPDPGHVLTSPDELARAVIRAEELIREPALPGHVLTGWAQLQQAAYRQLARRPEWHEEVLATAPGPIRDALRRNLDATVALRELTEPREELPADWRIVEPPPADELLSAYRAAGASFGIDWTYLAAIHLVETRMGRIRGDSTAGARGPMQFLPSTWEAYGEGDILDPADAIRAAARYLAAHGAPADMARALYAYNRSDRYVSAISDHAAVMQADERAYHAYHRWRVYYRLRSGDVVLPVGWAGSDAADTGD